MIQTNDKEALIARKQEILRELTQTRRRLAALSSGGGAPGNRQEQAQLEARIEHLMAEEYRLRIAIDRAR